MALMEAVKSGGIPWKLLITNNVIENKMVNKMKRYKVIFKFLNDLRELKDDYLDNDGKCYELEDAKYIASQLKTMPMVTSIEIAEI